MSGRDESVRGRRFTGPVCVLFLAIVSLNPAFGNDKNGLTAEEAINLHRQILSHWNLPVAARDVQDQTVEVTVAVNPDRTVQNVDIIDKNRMASGPNYRTLVESLIHAIYQTGPFQLPADKYGQWKKIDMTFSAKEML